MKSSKLNVLFYFILNLDDFSWSSDNILCFIQLIAIVRCISVCRDTFHKLRTVLPLLTNYRFHDSKFGLYAHKR